MNRRQTRTPLRWSQILSLIIVQKSNSLRSNETSQKISELVENDAMSALDLGAEIKNLMLDSARKCKIKKNKSTETSSPWFDLECEGKKNKIRNLGNLLRKDPG